MKLRITIALLLTMAPVLAFAKSGPSAHVRPKLYHDRAPRPHGHAPQPQHS